MCGRITVSGDSGQVFRRRIAFVIVESEAGIGHVQFTHDAIARDLGDNGRCRDGRTPPVPLDDAPLRERKVWNAEGVDDDHLGQRDKREHGLTHRVERRAMNVQAIDLDRLDRRDRPRVGSRDDQGIEGFAFWSRNELRVGESGDVTPGIENDRGGHHGAGKAAAPHFVDAGDGVQAEAPKRVLNRASCPAARHLTSPSRAVQAVSALGRGAFPSSAQPCPSNRAGNTTSRDGPWQSG
jgi:hypothetical protein